jgi:hypothetical protein
LISKNQLLEQIKPYELEFDYPRDNTVPSNPNFPSPSSYSQYSNFDDHVGSLGRKTASNTVVPTLEDFRSRVLRYTEGDDNALSPSEMSALDNTYEFNLEMARDTVEADGIDMTPEEYLGGSNAIDWLINGHGGGDFRHNTELAYDMFVDNLTDGSSGLTAKRIARPEYLTKDLRRDPQSKRKVPYPHVEGQHFTSDTLAHSRVFDVPEVDSTVISEIQSDAFPYIDKLNKQKLAQQRLVDSDIDTLMRDAGYLYGDSSPYTKQAQDALASDKFTTELDFLSQAPLKQNYPRVEMNRILAEAVAREDAPNYLIYNDASSVNPSAPKEMYTRTIPKEMQRLSRSYGIPLDDTSSVVLKSNVQPPEGYFNKSFPVRQHLDRLRKTGVPFLGALPAALLMQGEE